MKTRKQFYEPPLVLREVTLVGGASILAGSVVDSVSGQVTTSGQTVTEVSDGATFEYEWN